MTSLSFEDALLYAVQGRAILFIGAGFSTLFKDIESCPVPIGSGLATVMVDKCNGKPTKDREMHGIAKMGHILFLPGKSARFLLLRHRSGRRSGPDNDLLSGIG